MVGFPWILDPAERRALFPLESAPAGVYPWAAEGIHEAVLPEMALLTGKQIPISRVVRSKDDWVVRARDYPAGTITFGPDSGTVDLRMMYTVAVEPLD